MKKDSKDNKEKKPIYKRKWFVILAIILVIGIIGNIGNSDKKEVEKVAEIKETQAPTEVEIVEPTEPLVLGDELVTQLCKEVFKVEEATGYYYDGTVKIQFLKNVDWSMKSHLREFAKNATEFTRLITTFDEVQVVEIYQQGTFMDDKGNEFNQNAIVFTTNREMISDVNWDNFKTMILSDYTKLSNIGNLNVNKAYLSEL